MAHLHQERHVELVTGAKERFVVTSTMYSATIPTELPHLLVFVMAMSDSRDPQDDALARVCRISDLTSLPHNRDAALAAGGTEFLSQTCVLSYGTLTEAIAGAKAISDRVNQLIQDWETFTTQFNAPDPTPADIVLPSTTASQKQALINAYAAAKQASYAQLQTKVAADATLTAAQADYNYKLGLVSDMAAIDTASLTNQTEMNTAVTGATTLKTAGDTFLTAAGCAASGDKNTFQAALNTAAQQNTLNTGYVSDAAALRSLVSTYKTSRTTEQAAAQTALASAQANKDLQDDNLATAQAAEAAALSALLAVVPDFDPTIVPYVPG